MELDSNKETKIVKSKYEKKIKSYLFFFLGCYVIIFIVNLIFALILIEGDIIKVSSNIYLIDLLIAVGFTTIFGQYGEKLI